MGLWCYVRKWPEFISCRQAVTTAGCAVYRNVMQGGRPGLDDVSSLDAVLHSNLLAVKSCPPEQVEHLCLTFAAEQQVLGKVHNGNMPEIQWLQNEFATAEQSQSSLCTRAHASVLEGIWMIIDNCSAWMY